MHEHTLVVRIIHHQEEREDCMILNGAHFEFSVARLVLPIVK